jgi:acyl transferase domain-containing protein/enoyl-CoA hydratase/carnithine racemase
MNTKEEGLAVIGMSGKFPGANSVSEFWQNICAKKESIRSLSDEELRNAGVPERDIADSSYVKASALLDDVEMFDPGFFKISPLEAELMDPQIRLLLQCAWETLEDAGHASKEAQNIGVFAGAGGVTTSYFANFVNVDDRFKKITAGSTHLGNDKDFLATYISYKLNLTGPSMTVQTACSTSLVALHQASLSLLSGECDMALAGGVTVRVPHIQGYHYKEGYIFSQSGRIRSFDEGADGVVFGSGLGLVLIKRLTDAIAHGDNIYAVIKGSAIMNDGKGKMSYAASSAKGQIACVRAALKKAEVDAGSIGFVESHGTGTSMGDPEEVKALSAAFKEQTDRKAYCALGAVKANVGHLEAAAGIVGFIKAVLAVKHGLIPPTAQYTTPNPRIKFENTPFYVNTKLQKWDEGSNPRRAAVNSLGVGGTNAFVILENYVPPKRLAKKTRSAPVVVPLSAKSESSLRAHATKLAAFLAACAAKKDSIDIADLAYTLQTGREAMDTRVTFVVSTLAELKRDLGRYLDGKEIDQPTGDGANLAASWVAGGDVDWSKLYADANPRRISLPTYAFAKERCWIDSGSVAPARAVLHPLLHANTSDLNEQKYISAFSGEEFFLKDHLVRAKQRTGSASLLQKVLPAVAYLEMARAAIEQAAPIHSDASVLELRDIVWLRPIAVSGATQVSIVVVDRHPGGQSDQRIDFEIYTEDEHIHCQGWCQFSGASPRERFDAVQLKESMRQGQWSADGIYAAFTRMGLDYGPAHRPITGIERGDRELLARLTLPQTVEDSGPDYVLHPSLMDGALQAAIVLLFDPDSPPDHPIVPFAIETLRIVSPCTSEMLAWARYSQDSQPGDKSAKLDLDLLDKHGNLCVRIRGFAPRSLGRETLGSLLATQVWQPNDAPPGQVVCAEQHVVLCGLPQVDLDKIARDCSLLPCDSQKNIAARYSDLAVACFEKIRALIRSKPQGKTLVQIALANTEENAVHVGLSGLLKTARLENPQIAGQIVLVDAAIGTDQLAALLHADRGHPHDTLIKYERGVRYTASWRFLSADGPGVFNADSPFKDHGVYLITGGLGGLGVLFAKEILARTANATIVLTGRASPAEIKKSVRKKAILESLQAGGNAIEYRQLDLENPDQIEHLIASICKQYRQLNGIIHSAGTTADGFILKKSAAEFCRVLAPKVAGAFHLDRASRNVDLDFLVLFSSLTSAMGNLGQADYAAANGFLDEFAVYRNRLVKAGERRGATLAIRWPLWQGGGMQPDAAGRDMLYETTGIYPMQTATGMRMFYRSLALGVDQTLVMEGNLHAMQRTLGVGAALHAAAAAVETPRFEVPVDAQGGFAELSEAFLCKQLSALLKLPAHKLDPRAQLEDYGIDSILALDLTGLLEKTFGALPKTLFFEYLTIRELAAYFVKTHATTLSTLFSVVAGGAAKIPDPAPTSAPAQPASIRSHGRRLAELPGPALSRQTHGATEAIAIVGLSGRYPGGRDLQAFWLNLRDGKDCIVEVPKDRWDWRDYYSEDRSEKGRHYSKWGGFIEGVDEFDARFFNISPLEAETIDPQERLFLQHAWMAMEDAGYTRAALQIPKANDLPAQVGVYAGTMYGEYQLFGAEASLQGNRMGFASNLASIANRASYALNLHGPSMAVDTMCSSSLTAIHLACQDLKLGRTSLGIAGGVSVTIHPNKYLMLSAGQFISSDGHCQSFGEGGDGYIPGEGIGVVVLKRLSEAERDGNQIYGVIRGSALSHGGKTNGYTVPNPQAQASAIRQALAEAGVDPRHVSYVEAHGTGTKLGDPIEIAALSKVFQESTQDTGFCLIGSAKSNIGHCEAAAGIAGLTKVLLQMKHKQIVPSLHSTRLNPHIDFDRTPFVVNQTLRSWEQPIVDGRPLPLPRIAGISSFGAGGSNAHLIVEEYQQPARLLPAAHPQPNVLCVVPLSARTAEQLRQKAGDLLDFIRGEQPPLHLPLSLASIAYTLQIGRDAMDERLAVLTDSVAALADRLQAWLDGEAAVGNEGDVYQGQVKANKDTLSLFTQDPDLHATVAKWIADRQLSKLADLWVKGLELDWHKFHGADGATPALISLPTYPFAKQRFWIDAAIAARRVPKALSTAALHPLLHKNTSDFSQQSYAATFGGDEFFLAGAHGRRCLTEAACLEMARAAIDVSLPAQKKSSILELRDVAWAQPGVVVDNRPVTIALFDKLGEQLAFEIYSAGGADGADSAADIVHCQGRAVRSDQPAGATLDIAALAAHYGQALVELRLPTGMENGQDDYVLHPALMHSALQAAAGLTGGLLQPFVMASLRVVFPSIHAKFAWARYSASVERTIDIDLCDEHGHVCVQMRGLRYEVSVNISATGAAQTPAERAVAPTGSPAPVPKPVSFAASGSVKPAGVRFDASSAIVSDAPILKKPNRSIALKVPGDSLAIAAKPATASRVRLAVAQAISDGAQAVISDGPILGKPIGSIVLMAPDASPAIDAERGASAKPRVFLSASLSAPVAAARTPEQARPASCVGLFDHGNGVFAIRIDATASDNTGNTLSADLIEDLLRAMRTVEDAASAKVLTIEGSDAHFLAGGLAQHRDAVSSKLYRAIADFPYPVIAVVRGDAVGAGFLAAAVSDFMVCSDSARFAFALPEEGLYPSAAEDLLIERFGRVHATDLLYLTAGATGAELKSKGWTCPFLPRDQVAAYAQDLAENLAKKSQISLRLLKQHLVRRIAGAVQALPAADGAPFTADATKSGAIQTRFDQAPSDRLQLEAHGERALVVRIRAQADGSSAKDLLADLEAMFAKIADDSPYRCVVLASELAQFLPQFSPDIAEDARADVAQGFRKALLGLGRPIVAALNGDATGIGWYVAQFCDACVYSERGRYSCADVLRDPALAGEVSTMAAVFSLRFGDEAAKQILLAGAEASGDELRADYGALHVLAADHVLAGALELADALAAFPTPVLSAWKQRSAAFLTVHAAALDDENIQVEPGSGDTADMVTGASGAPVAVALASTVISAIAHPEGILEVRMADREAKNMFSDAFSRGMREVFAHVEQSRLYKVVVLTGYDNYFSSGGTQDTLLAIHEGRARFTDNKVFQLPLTCTVPVIAAMQGHGIGAGWAMGMYADFALFSDKSRYFSPYMDYGFTPGAGSTLMFPEKIGVDLARETLLTAQEYFGGELKDRGLRNPVLSRDRVLPAALALARRIAQGSRSLLVALKRRWAHALQASLQDTFDRELAMHARTFVGQADTLARIQGRFGFDSAAQTVAPQPSITLPTPMPASLPAREEDLVAISASLKQMLAHELRMQEHEIDEDEQFVDLGLDSITGVTWIRKINETYGTSIEAIKIYGYPTLTRLARFVQEQTPSEAAPVVTTAAAPAVVSVAKTADATIKDVPAITATLRTLLAHELRMQEHEIGDDEQFVDLGLDSITGVTWIRRINEKYSTAIEAIKIYSYPTLTQLSRYVREEAEKAGAVFVAPRLHAPVVPVVPVDATAARPVVTTLASWRASSRSKSGATASATGWQPVAVIGMAGQFAKAGDLDQFWQNIAQGRDCIEEIPKHRWDIDLYFQEGEVAPGKTYSRWMGTLEEYDRFDAAFFNISPREAKSMDPQQRLFLQACWHSIEHAGYQPKALAGSRCGVFVGCAAGDYHQLSKREQLSGQGFIGAAPSILAARISYFLDLHGPSLSIDTACSSSLVAIATACDSLVSGGSDIALAGGVNVMAGPAMQIMAAQVGMLSPQGRCFTFDERANGMVNGEGVGVVMLKRLADAERDRDCIYGVVEGWGVNQDGKTNGITAPNPDSHARLQQEVYQKFGIDPAGIGLIEAHGTGTALGDPIEVAGLKTSFGKFTRNKNNGEAYCALGSVKSNIGHCLSAAGISGFLKILLALKHEQLPPTIHFSKLNKHISLQDTPFYINDRLREWKRIGIEPRRAAINAFGFGGTNAHAVIAEYRLPHDGAQQETTAHSETAIVPLSARTADQLKRKARDLLAFIRAQSAATLDLDRIAYTLQVGREPMNERAAFIAGTVAELENRLQAFIEMENADGGAQAAHAYRGEVSSNKDTLLAFSSDTDFQTMIAKWIGKKELPRLADLWVKGLALDWNIFHAAGDAPRRIGLPLYPFAKERYWIDAASDERIVAASATIGSVNVVSACDEEMFAWVRPSEADPQMADIDLYDRDGNVCVQLKELALEMPTVAAHRPAQTEENAAETAAEIESARAGAQQATPVVRKAQAAVQAVKASVQPSRPSISQEQLRQQLRASLAEALFMKPSDVDVNKSFTELGLDSIIGVEWVKTINKQYATGISATRVYDYPSVKEFAAYLQAEIGGAASEASDLQAAVTASVLAPIAAPIAVPQARPAAQPAISREALQQQLKASLAEALFMKPFNVDVNKSFTELGLDSIIGVEWIKTVNKQYGTNLSATRVYDYPSVKELAAFLIGELAATELPQCATPSAESNVPAAPLATVVAPGDTQASRVRREARIVAQPPLAKAAFAGRAAGFPRLARIRFEPKYARQFKDLYFYSADGEGDFEAEGEFSIRCAINPETNVCLKEHVVFNAHLLPTDAYIELVYSAYRTYFSSKDVCLKNIAIVNPILGTKGRDTHVKVVFRRAGDDLQFFVKSSMSSDFRNDKLHMQGFIAHADGAPASRFDDGFAIEKTLAGAAIPTNAGAYYAPLQTLRFGESSALGLIRVADHDFAFLANPFALYGGLCTVINYGAYLAGRHYGASDDQFLPYRIGQIALLGSLDDSDYRCYAEVRKLEQDSMEFYFEIVDRAGEPLLVVDSIVLRRVARKTLLQQATTAPLLPAIDDRRAFTGNCTGMGAGTGSAAEKIAIIGMSCRYPMSENVDAFWENLKAGKDCVIEVPADRWRAYADWYNPDPSHPHTSYSKWGGFLDSIDSFDPLFFGISPVEAEFIDPQQRIFLEECWKTIESAGYAPSTLSNRSCGVYVGCTSGDYARLLAADGQDTAGAAFMGTSNAILAARISYYLNLKGPAVAIDTACSSSLVAVHLACASIRSGENQLALAGGVNVLTTPFGHILTSQVGMLTRDGRCASFDASASGIVFSEGCGVLLLKALSEAERDNDDILGVIEGSGINQDGKTNGITAPSSRAQEQLLRQVYGTFGIDPKRISYVEAHGTATPLGDPIEVNALTSVFGKSTTEGNTCALGSVKSNIGHAGVAAGVAGIVKVLLCIKHRKLVPSIHYSQPNPHIEFEKSPFYVNTQYCDWASDQLHQPRLATVSAFGFSGTNAHIVIEEHVPSSQPVPAVQSGIAPDGKVLVPLSAKAAEQLQQKVRHLLDFIGKQEQPVDLARLAYTLQIGRDAMDHRLGFIVGSVDQLAEKLQGYLDGKSHIEDVYRGQASHGDDTLAAFAGDAEMRDVIERWIARKNLPKVSDLWVRGFEMDWNRMHEGAKPRRMTLPTYPFARERCWVDGAALPKPGKPLATDTGATTVAPLHQLLHRNTSDLSQQSYASTFGGDEFFLADHRVNGQPVLPAVAYLEMARAALMDAMPAEKASLHLELRHVVWAQPIVVSEPKSVVIAVFSEHGEQVDFEVYSQDGDAEEVLHCQGSCVMGDQPKAQTLDLDRLRTRMSRGSLDGAMLYPLFATMGLNYGPAFRGIVAIHQGEHELLVELSLPDAARKRGGNYILHPSLMDSALQGSIALIDDLVGASGKSSLPFALESLRIFSACTDRMVAWVRYSQGGQDGRSAASSNLIKVDIDLCDPDGNLCVQMRGFSSRPMESIVSFDEAHYQSIIAGIVSDEISVDQAVELGNL